MRGAAHCLSSPTSPCARTCGGWLTQTLSQFGRIDVWINNAGIGITRPPSQLTDEDIDAMIQANVKSALYGMQEVLPHFKERNAGHIINISSMLGRVPFATVRSAYSGAKHFLNALTAMFRDELRESHPGIQFSLVSPGVVRTDFGLNAMHGGPDSRQFPGSQSAEEVAAVIARVIATRAPDVYTLPGARTGSPHITRRLARTIRNDRPSTAVSIPSIACFSGRTAASDRSI